MPLKAAKPKTLHVLDECKAIMAHFSQIICLLTISHFLPVLSVRQPGGCFRQTAVIHAKLETVPVALLSTILCSARCQANKATCAVFQITGGVCKIEDYSLDASHAVRIDSMVFLRPGQQLATYPVASMHSFCC